MTFHDICPYPLGPNTLSQGTRLLPVLLRYIDYIFQLLTLLSLKVMLKNGYITPNTVTRPSALWGTHLPETGCLIVLT